MNKIALITAIALATCAAQPAYAAYESVPVPAASDTVEYDRGTAILTRETADKTIRIVHVEEYYGRPSLFIEVENHGDAPFNFGVEDIQVSFDGEKRPTKVHTREEVEKQAENSAMWSGLAGALVGGLSGYSSYSSTTKTPYGTYETSGSYFNSFAAQSRTAQLTAENNAMLASRLNEARESVIQTTTVRPGEGYGGRVVLSKPRVKFPAEMRLIVLGEEFTVRMTK